MIKTEGYTNAENFLSLTPKNGVKASKLYLYKPTDGTGDIAWSRALPAYRVNQSGVLELMGSNVPRIDYSNTCPEILIEEERENLALYSNKQDEFPDWLFYGIDPPTGGQIDPENGTDGFRLTEDTSLDLHYLYQNFTYAGANATGSIHAREGTRNWIYLRFLDSAGTPYTTWFNLNDGTIGTNNDGNVAEIKLANGYYRCSIKNNLNFVAGSTSLTIGLADSDGNDTYLGDGSYVDVYGGQIEGGKYVTSLIPTTTVAVTRPIDNNTGLVSFSTNISFVIRFRLVNRNDVSVPDYIYSISDGTGDVYILVKHVNDRLIVEFNNFANNIEVFTALSDNGIYNLGVGLDLSNGEYGISLNGATLTSGTLTNEYGILSDYTEQRLGGLAGGVLAMGQSTFIGAMTFDSFENITSLNNLTTE